MTGINVTIYLHSTRSGILMMWWCYSFSFYLVGRWLVLHPCVTLHWFFYPLSFITITCSVRMRIEGRGWWYMTLQLLLLLPIDWLVASSFLNFLTVEFDGDPDETLISLTYTPPGHTHPYLIPISNAFLYPPKKSKHPVRSKSYHIMPIPYRYPTWDIKLT